jgi:hypothetical protein
MTLSIKSRRSLGWTGWMAAVAAATLAVLVLGAATAQAQVRLSPTGSYRSGDTVTVTGTVPGGLRTVTHYAVALCNATVTLGTRCDAATASTLLAIATYRSPGYRLVLSQTFNDFDFTTGRPAGTRTTCRGMSGDQCAVVVSFYGWDRRSAPRPLGDDNAVITFS